MTLAPKRPCRHPGCSALVSAPATRCAQHSVQQSAFSAARRARDRHRGTAHERGYDARWREASRGFLSRYPLCLGVLIPTRDHTPALAETFHILRETEREAGRLADGAGLPRALCEWLELHPIYELRPWDPLKAAVVVDHIIPHKGDATLFWSEWNWQPLTKRAHDRKTASEDGGAWRPAL